MTARKSKSAQVPISFTDDQLKDFALFVKSAFDDYDQAIKTMLNMKNGVLLHPFAMDVAIIGFRIFVDFFYKTNRAANDQDDDVLAVDYLPGWTPQFPKAMFKIQKNRTNKLVAHLSFSRLKLKGTSWDLQQFIAIRRLFGQFLTDLPKDKLRWFIPGDADLV